MLPYMVQRESQQLGFFQYIPMALSALLQVKAQSNAKKLEQQKIKAIQAMQIAQAQSQAQQSSGMLGGLSPLTIGLLVGVPVLALLFLRK